MNEKIPAISIITPTYNRAWCIERAIKSVLGQTFGDWEMIVVDDGSTDETHEKVEKHAHDPRIRYVSQKNRGANIARNHGVRLARADNLIFLDSDDELLPGALEMMNRDIRQAPDDVSMCVYPIVEVRSGETPKPHHVEEKEMKRFGYRDYLCGNNELEGEKLPIMKRSIVVKHGFPEYVNGAEMVLWVKMYKEFDVLLGNVPVRLYHIHGESLCHSENIPSLHRAQAFSRANGEFLSVCREDVARWCPARLGEQYLWKAYYDLLANRSMHAYRSLFQAFRAGHVSLRAIVFLFIAPLGRSGMLLLLKFKRIGVMIRSFLIHRENRKREVLFMAVHAYSLFNKKHASTFGGAEVQLYQYAVRLAKHSDNRVVFLVADHGQKKSEIFDGVEVRPVYALGKRNLLHALWGAWKLFFLLCRIGPSVCVLRSAGPEVGIVGIYCWMFGKKFLYMTASTIDVDGTYVKSNGIRGMLFEFGLRRATIVIVQSLDQKRDLKINYNKRAILLKNSFDVPESVLPFEARRFILWVGSCQKLKQPDVFLGLAKLMPEEKFVMILSDSDGDLRRKVEAEAAGISNLRLLRRVALDESHDYFRRAKVLVNTSAYEGFPNTFVQAAMNGTPIVSLHVHPDGFLSIHSCGYCAKGSVDLMRNFVEHLVFDVDSWNEKSQNVRDYAQRNHDIAKNLEKLKEILKIE